MARNRYYAGPQTDHFDGIRFHLEGHDSDRNLSDILRWRFGSSRAAWPASAPCPALDHPPERVEGAALRVSYVGHATVLVQTRGLNLLIDPVWAERASPFTWAGPKRVNRPGIDLDHLPPLDAVLVSHNHYDHMDLRCLSRLARTHAPRVLTPLGNDAIMRRFDRAIDAEAHDWGARIVLSGAISVHLEPAYHWSARGISDRRMALWCAFVIETPDGVIYHIADTGWGTGALFSAVREKHGAPRLAILPIGAYEPRWFMQPQHVDPHEAVRIFELTAARQALAHHWGTFQLTDEAIDEPPRQLGLALRAAGIDPGRFRVLRPGEVFDVPD